MAEIDQKALVAAEEAVADRLGLDLGERDLAGLPILLKHEFGVVLPDLGVKEGSRLQNPAAGAVADHNNAAALPVQGGKGLGEMAEKGGVADGLGQEGKGVDLIALHGVLIHAGNKEDGRAAALLPEAAGGLHTAEAGHADVQQEHVQVPGHVGEQLLGGGVEEGVKLLAGLLADLLEIAGELTGDRLLVVTDCDCADHAGITP